MTPRERAERIMQLVVPKGFHTPDLYDDCIGMIEDHIEAALREQENSLLGTATSPIPHSEFLGRCVRCLDNVYSGSKCEWDHEHDCLARSDNERRLAGGYTA